MGNYIDTIAKSLILELSLSIPINIELLCRNLNITLKSMPINAEAFLLCKNGNKVILTNNLRNEQRVRFSIAHEIGHYLIPWQNRFLYCCNKSDLKFSCMKEEEKEANSFAAALLTPKKELMQVIKGNTNTCQSDLIREIQSKFNVSFTMAAIRLIDIFCFDSALVYSKNKIIEWFYKGKYFNGDIRLGKLQEDTFAYKKINENGVYMQKVSADNWIIDNEYPYIEEETITMPRFDASLTILNWPRSYYE